MIPYQRFLTAPRSIYSRPWTDVPWRIISWGLEQIGLQQVFQGAGTRTSKDIVLIPNVEQAAEKIVDRLQGRSSQVIKTTGPDRTLLPISKEDQTVASLKGLVSNIDEGIRRLESRIANLAQRSREAVALKNRQLALAALRSKRLAESILSQRSDTRFQLEQVLESIKQASDQITMLHVMKDSAEVLGSLNAQIGNVDNVEEALDSVKNEMEKAKDISSAISEAGLETGAANENELDQELDVLLREQEHTEDEKAAKTTKQRLASIQDTANNERVDAKMPSPAENTGSAAPTIAPDSLSVSEETPALQCMSLNE
ncbi:MAG: hypothetical protein Q9218_002303 [Villophora microphyllina]